MPRSFLVKNKPRLDGSLSYSYKDDTVPKDYVETFHKEIKEFKQEDYKNTNMDVNELRCFQPCCVSNVLVPHVSKEYWESRFPLYSKSCHYSTEHNVITERPDVGRLSPLNGNVMALTKYDIPLRTVPGKTKFYEVATSQSAVTGHYDDNIIVVKPSDSIAEQLKDNNSIPTNRRSPNNKDHNGACNKKKDKQTRHFSCKYCDKDYMTLGALKMHIRTHTLPCKCTICGKAFSRPWLLQGHIRTHTGERPFGCSYCGRAFADRSNLRAHIQTHVDVKKYECKQCLKTFSRSTLLKKHELMDCVAANDS